MRKLLAACAAITLALALSAGSCDQKEPVHTERRPGAPQAQPKANQPAPGANQPGPQNDPGACNQRRSRDIELQAHWTSDKRYPPRVFWSKNGVETPATNLKSEERRTLGWSGEWSTMVTGDCHDVIEVRMEGVDGQTHGLVSIVDLGEGPVKTGLTCKATYTVP